MFDSSDSWLSLLHLCLWLYLVRVSMFAVGFLGGWLLFIALWVLPILVYFGLVVVGFCCCFSVCFGFTDSSVWLVGLDWIAVLS